MTTGIRIDKRQGVVHLAGVLDEYADLTPLLIQAEPLHLNLLEVTRLNSIGVRNLLKFLATWGAKAIVYEHCPAEFIDQICMIPALLGQKKQGSVASFYVPYECPSCDSEHDIYGVPSEYEPGLKSGTWPQKECPSCGTKMNIVTDAFFSFMTP